MAILSIEGVREQIERETAPAKPEPKKPLPDLFTTEDCGDYLKLTWKG